MIILILIFSMMTGAWGLGTNELLFDLGQYRELRVSEDLRCANAAEKHSSMLNEIFAMNIELVAIRAACQVDLEPSSRAALSSSGKALAVFQDLSLNLWKAQSQILLAQGSVEIGQFEREPMNSCGIPGPLKNRGALLLQHVSTLGGFQIDREQNEIAWKFYNPSVSAL